MFIPWLLFFPHQLITNIQFSLKGTLKFCLSVFRAATLIQSPNFLTYDLMSPGFAFHKITRPRFFCSVWPMLIADFSHLGDRLVPGFPPHWQSLEGFSPTDHAHTFLKACSCSAASWPSMTFPPNPGLSHHQAFHPDFPGVCWQGLLSWNCVLTCTFELFPEPHYPSKTESMSFCIPPGTWYGALKPTPLNRWLLIEDDVMGFLASTYLYLSCCGDKRFSDRAFLIRIGLRQLSAQGQSWKIYTTGHIIALFIWTSLCFNYSEIIDKSQKLSKFLGGESVRECQRGFILNNYNFCLYYEHL